MFAAVFVVEQSVAHANVYALISRSTKGLFGTFGTGRTKGQTVSKGSFQCEAPAGRIGEVVGKEERHVVTLVCRTGNPGAVNLLLRAHERESQPRVCTRDKFAVELEIYTGGISLGSIATVINYTNIVNGVRDEVG